MTYREEHSLGGEEGFGRAAAPVDDSVGGDVQEMKRSEGVRFSIDGEARRCRDRAGVSVNSCAVCELRRRCELEVVALVEPGCRNHVKEVRKGEGNQRTEGGISRSLTDDALVRRKSFGG